VLAPRVVGLVGFLVSLATLPRLHARALAAYFAKRTAHNDEGFFVDCRRGVWPNRIFRALPAPPRCALCFQPFSGIGRYLLGAKPSRKNPKVCDVCFARAPIGGHAMDIGVFFADVRGYTALAEREGDAATARLLNRFYRVATDVLVERFAIIDKLVGDEVMALFVPEFLTLGDRTCEIMVEAALALLNAVGYGGGAAWLPLGIGLHYGPAQVGNVGAGDVKDFTAIGDVVNTAARLQGVAKAGTVLLSDEVYARVGNRYPRARRSTVKVKGKRAPIPVHVLTLKGATT